MREHEELGVRVGEGGRGLLMVEVKTATRHMCSESDMRLGLNGHNESLHLRAIPTC